MDRTLAQWSARVKALQTMVYAALFTLLTSVIPLPLSVYQDFYREHEFGLANQSFWPWFGEQMIGLTVNIVISSLALAAIYAVVRRSPRS